jgi:hypothetical protein
VERNRGNLKRKSRQIDAKIFFTALSITITLGAWQAFSRQEAVLAVKKAAELPAAQVSLDAAPLPTLIPPLALQPNAPDSQQPDRLFLGGAKPQSSRPAPVARTGSSR